MHRNKLVCDRVVDGADEVSLGKTDEVILDIS